MDGGGEVYREPVAGRKDQVGRPRCRRGAIIKMDTVKQVQKAWKGFVWLKTGTIVGLL